MHISGGSAGRGICNLSFGWQAHDRPGTVGQRGQGRELECLVRRLRTGETSKDGGVLASHQLYLSTVDLATFLQNKLVPVRIAIVRQHSLEQVEG